jgi:hypothetical protein
VATQAKSNIAVSNDCTSGVFTPNQIVTINGSDRSTAVRMASVQITLNRNDQPDTATLIVNRDGGFTPAAGHTIGIALGDSLNYIFAGQIVLVNYLRANSADLPDFELTCTDWTPLFNRRLITADFSGQSATDIATTIVEDYTSGFFTYGIDSGLATIDEFICVNETPLGAIRRLANILGGGCDINPLSTLKAFAPEYDFSQIRTRVYVEGRSTRTLTPVPVGATSFPIEEGWIFLPSGGTARAGSQRISFSAFDGFPLNFGDFRQSTTLTSDAAAGASSIEVAATLDVYNGHSPRWLTDGAGNYFHASVVDSDTLGSIPAAGEFGCLPVPLVTGQTIWGVDALLGVEVDGVSGTVFAIEVGDTVAVEEMVEDASAQSAVAAIEGGDGIHEHSVVDGRLSSDGCAERAQAELDTFSASLTRASWVTHDMQAVAGATQATNITSPTFNTSLTIDSVSIDFLVDNTAIAASPAAPCDSNRWPRRVVQGSTVKLETVLDAIIG